MFARGLEGWHFIVLAVIVLLVWGGPKLPGMAKNLGESMRVFRKEMKTMGDEKARDKADKEKAAEKSEEPGSQDNA